MGHGLVKDLQALGLSHPDSLTTDTMRFRKFQRKGGTARKLKDLAQAFLGHSIQTERRHSAR